MFIPAPPPLLPPHTHPAMRNSHMAATALCADSGGQLIQFDPVTQGERPSS